MNCHEKTLADVFDSPVEDNVAPAQIIVTAEDKSDALASTRTSVEFKASKDNVGVLAGDSTSPKDDVLDLREDPETSAAVTFALSTDTVHPTAATTTTTADSATENPSVMTTSSSHAQPRVRTSTELKLGPQVELHRLRRCTGPRMKEIVPGLVLGNFTSSWNRKMLKDNQISAILSLRDCRSEWWGSFTRKAGIPESRHKFIQCWDSSRQDILVHMSDACDFIKEMAPPSLEFSSGLPSRAADDKVSRRGDSSFATLDAVLVHCDMGMSRSPTIIIAYLMRKYRMNFEEISEYVRTRARVRPSDTFTRQLRIWHEVGYQIWEDEAKTIPKPQYQEYLNDRAVMPKRNRLTWHEPLSRPTSK